MLSIMYIANCSHFPIFMETKIINFFRDFIIASACQKMDIYLNLKNKWRFKIAKNFDVR